MQSKMILGAVGKGLMVPNHHSDVKVVQALLNSYTNNRRMSCDPSQHMVVNGLVTPLLIARIEDFQRKILGIQRPDGRVDPGGKTLRALNQQLWLSQNVPIHFTLSSNGTKLLKQIETGNIDAKPQLKPYDDQTKKEITQWVEGATIGYGHLISNAEWSTYKTGLTEQDAESLFKKDLAVFEDCVNNCVKIRLSQQQFDALVFLAYNIGCNNFKSSSVVLLVNDPTAKTEYADLQAAWKAWRKSQGKVMNGLENRRQAELNIYHKGVYEKW